MDRISRIANARVFRYEQGAREMQIDPLEMKKTCLLRKWQRIQSARLDVDVETKEFRREKKKQRDIMIRFAVLVFVPGIVGIATPTLIGLFGGPYPVFYGLMALFFFATGILPFVLGAFILNNILNSRYERRLDERTAGTQKQEVAIRAELIALISRPGSIQERVMTWLLTTERAPILGLPSPDEEKDVIETKLVSRV